MPIPSDVTTLGSAYPTPISMIMLIWLHVHQILLRIVFTYMLIYHVYRKVSVLHVNRTFVHFTHDAYFVHNGQKMLVQSSLM
jgi:hypothetical protein